MLLRAVARSAQSARLAAGLTRSAAFSRPLTPVAWARGMASDDKSGSSRFAKAQKAVPEEPSQPSTSSSHETSEPGVSGRSDSHTDVKDPRDSVKPTSEEASASAKASELPADQQPDLSKLPDLTQGIPSTLEYEMASARSQSSLEPAQQEETAATPGAGGRGKGELPASAYISSSERRRQRYANYMFAAAGVAIVGGCVYMGRDWEEDELERHPETPNGWGLGLWWNRVTTRLSEMMNYYQEPAFEKLLPDPDPSYERPYTLCISLEDLLVHSEWTREHGWRIAKRPGMDYFLRYLSQYYEIVLFTTVPFAIGEPLLRKLDPFRFIMWPLFREATKFKDGEIVKDLSYLNRDLSKVVVIDTNEKHVRNQSENAIVLPKWKGDPKDDELVALIPFLEYIFIMQYGDVRKVLKSFEGKHIPTEFARREAIARAEFNKQREGQLGKRAPKGSGGGLGMLGGMLGLKPSSMSMMVSPEGEENPTEAFAKGKMLQDIARERGMKAYMAIEKEIRENGEKWLKEEAEQQEKMQKEAMKNMQSSFTSWFGMSSGKPDEPSQSPAEKE